MPANDREVFEFLKADENTPVEIDLFTFAIFAHEKQEWCELFEKQKERKPKQTEIDSWISEITEWRYGQMRQEAIQFFDRAAREYLAEEIEEEKEQILQDTLLREVKAAGGFWRQLAMQVITAVLAPLFIGLIIAAALLYDRNSFSATSVSDRLQPPAKAPAASTP